MPVTPRRHALAAPAAVGAQREGAATVAAQEFDAASLVARHDVGHRVAEAAAVAGLRQSLMLFH